MLSQYISCFANFYRWDLDVFFLSQYPFLSYSQHVPFLQRQLFNPSILYLFVIYDYALQYCKLYTWMASSTIYARLCYREYERHRGWCRGNDHIKFTPGSYLTLNYANVSRQWISCTELIKHARRYLGPGSQFIILPATTHGRLSLLVAQYTISLHIYIINTG